MTQEEHDTSREALRLAILDAMDDWAKELYGDLPYVRGTRTPGATDGDLQHIFPAIDEQFNRLIERFGLI